MDPLWRVSRMSDHEWAYRRPPVLVPAPAAEETGPLTGQRVVMHEPDHAVWRYDFRAASEPHRRAGQWCIGVLAEADWYRRQRDPVNSAHIVPFSVPLDRLWVEHPIDHADDAGPLQTEEHVEYEEIVVGTAGTPRHVVDSTEQPPVRYLRPALDEPAVNPGARACVMDDDGPEWGLRICGAPRLEEFPEAINMSGGLEKVDEVPVGPTVPVCFEKDWYAWAQTGRTPGTTHMWLVPVWLE